MPKIVADKAFPAIRAEDGAHHYRLGGLEVKSITGLYNWQLIELGAGNETTLAQVPSQIQLYRMYIHGDDKVGGKRGITLNSQHTTIRNCWISNFKSTWQDTQTIAGWNGPGPFVIENNYLEASGENLNFGGSTPAIPNLVPSDITIRRNHISKPLSWRKADPSYAGTPWSVKNSFELKNARRVVFEGNIVENNWEDDQRGYAVQLTVRTNSGAVPWAVVEDITIQRNIFRHCAAGINLAGTDTNGTTSYGGKLRRVVIRDNVFEDVNSRRWGGSGILFQVLSGTEDVTIEHNTGFHNEEVVHFEGLPSTGFIYRNNISKHNLYGINGAGTASGDRTLDRFAPDAVVTHNVMAGGSAALYPSGNHFPATLDAVRFVNEIAGDYRLSSTSPYLAKGTDGKALGADVNAVQGATVGVDIK